MVYVKAELNVLPGKMTAYSDLMKELIPVIAKLQWILVASYVNATGRQGGVVNIWQIPDANAFSELSGQLAKNPRAAQLLAGIHECIEPEVVTLVTAAVYSPGYGA